MFLFAAPHLRFEAPSKILVHIHRTKWSNTVKACNVNTAMRIARSVWNAVYYRILSLLNTCILQLIPWKNFLLKYIFHLRYIRWHDIKVTHCLYDFSFSPVRNISHSTTEVAGWSSTLHRHYKAIWCFSDRAS